MQDSIFTKIIRGEIPCHKIYEDENTLAFLDINPAQPGHTLVIPKSQVEFVWDLPEAEYVSLMTTTQKVARWLKQALDSPYIGELVVGTDVPHAHVHLVPFQDSSQLAHIFDPGRIPPDDQSLADMAAQLRF